MVQKHSTSIYNIETFGAKYTKIKFAGAETSVLGEGGNAVVYSVKSSETGDVYALKFLKTLKSEKKKRFLEEIDIVLNNYKDIDGILPIIDFDKDGFWYTMPCAKSVIKHISENQADIFQIAHDFRGLVDTFIQLHKKGITHRDIKPDNVYYYNGQYYVGDFGLVDYPDKEHQFTRSDQGIGAIFTIAPEMKRDPLHVKDARKADVYSLAKTLWMLITGDDKGFDGQYDYTNVIYALRLKEQYRHTHLAELELLLQACTNDNPDERPTIEEFANQLDKWIEISNDSDKSAYSDWHFLNRLIFREDTPRSIVYDDTKQIVKILNLICWLPTYNHVMFSTGGGLDMTEVSLAQEDGCMCIKFGNLQTSILKPKALHYETFGKDVAWNYWILELDSLNPIFELPKEAEDELLDEDYPGHYVSAQDFQYGVYNYEEGSPLPETARLVCRHVKGKLLIVLKFGQYNMITETYDGRHGACTIEEFREYIENLIKVSHTPHSLEDVRKAISKIRKPDEIDLESYLHEEESIAPKNFIKDNILTWNFSEFLPKEEDGNAILLFKAEVSFSDILRYIAPQDRYWLLEDGTIGKVTEGTKPFLVTNRQVFLECTKSIETKVSDYVKEAGYDKLSPLEEFYFSPQLVRNGKPIHLFTKEEIKDLMRQADDRTNNQLVIDEFGYAQIIQQRGLGAYYPVSHETWEAGNNYVGKYSSLSTLDESYIDSLRMWLNYLKTGKCQYSDYSEYIDVESVIEEIHKYY